MVEEFPQVRREAVQLVQQAVGAGRCAYVLVNNRCGGNAPLTVQGLVETLRGEPAAGVIGYACVYAIGKWLVKTCGLLKGSTSDRRTRALHS